MDTLVSDILAGDFLRTVVLGLLGVIFGLALSEGYLYLRRYREHDEKGVRLMFMAVVRVGIAGASVFMATEAATRFGEPLTYRAPLGTFVMVCFIVGMGGILRDDYQRLMRAHRRSHPLRRQTDR